ncbi:hypothetical protein LB505_010018 [Fusarium chuoi]|nr:hypothetical protein LB505_010018 [Fusarium chuoi]
MQQLRDEASKILIPELANLKGRVRENAELRMKKRQGGVVVLNWAYASQDGTSWLMNDLDVCKINNAAGKRPEDGFTFRRFPGAVSPKSMTKMDT